MIKKQNKFDNLSATIRTRLDALDLAAERAARRQTWIIGMLLVALAILISLATRLPSPDPLAALTPPAAPAGAALEAPALDLPPVPVTRTGAR